MLKVLRHAVPTQYSLTHAKSLNTLSNLNGTQRLIRNPVRESTCCSSMTRCEASIDANTCPCSEAKSAKLARDWRRATTTSDASKACSLATKARQSQRLTCRSSAEAS